MRSLRLKNFRSLVDTGRIELRPLTVLVGANSSGKSSFLRFFPLLRQTYRKASASPLLWYGRDVDFGDYSQVVRRGAEAEGIEVEIELDVTDFNPYLSRPTWLSMPLRITSHLAQLDGKTYVRRSVLACNGDTVVREFKNRSELSVFRINQQDQLPKHSEQRLAYEIRGDANLIPSAAIMETESRHDRWREVNGDIANALDKLLAATEIKPSDKKRAPFVLRYSDNEGLLRQLKEEPPSKRYRDKLGKLDLSGTTLDHLRTSLLQRDLDALIDQARVTLEAAAASILYIGPSRVTGERFYRTQEIEVENVDARGENLAMFLRALSSERLADFSHFMMQHIGLNLKLESQGSNISILLVDDVGNTNNLIDMGYGFSQVLPVIAQCWAVATGWRASTRSPWPGLIAIEQPELHLHPYYQAKLADLFVTTLEAARRWSAPQSAPPLLPQPALPPLMVETHSDALLNRLGELVEEKRLSSDDVQVLLFEQDPKTKNTTVRQSTFDADGTLTNWPIGFFAP